MAAEVTHIDTLYKDISNNYSFTQLIHLFTNISNGVELFILKGNYA